MSRLVQRSIYVEIQYRSNVGIIDISSFIEAPAYRTSWNIYVYLCTLVEYPLALVGMSAFGATLTYMDCGVA